MSLDCEDILLALRKSYLLIIFLDLLENSLDYDVRIECNHSIPDAIKIRN